MEANCKKSAEGKYKGGVYLEIIPDHIEVAVTYNRKSYAIYSESGIKEAMTGGLSSVQYAGKLSTCWVEIKEN